MELIGLVAVFVVIQSLFGVGILVFGTPTLLLLGYSYEHTLSLLLPCSLCVSIFQVTEHWDEIQDFRTEFSIWCLPFVGMGLSVALLGNSEVSLKLAVAALLLFSAACRVSQRLELHLKHFLRSYRKLFLAILGIVHGVSNMGGGLLTVFANTVYSGKERIRGHISFAYGLMAMIQLAILFLFNRYVYSPQTLSLLLLTATIYQLIGRRIFVKATNTVYRHSMTFLMFGFAVLLFATAD